MSEMTVSANTDVLVDYLKQWNIGSGRNELVMPKASFKEAPQRSYSLLGKGRVFLQHEKQTWGINLGWTDDANPSTGVKVSRWFFTREGDNLDPIRYGETIALGNGGDPSFIRYAHRTVGINLDWAKKPVFEWKLLGGTIGDPVRTDTWLAIYNEKSMGENGPGECLIYFDRTRGGDIGYPTSKTWGDQAVDVIIKKLGPAAVSIAYKFLLG